ncbi:MAG: hypothetical protein P8J86_05525 [Phycisphaerales bacterium]|nr:hypothetical protein [Phycisphaerales bacterium]
MRQITLIASVLLLAAAIGCSQKADLSAYHGPPFTVDADTNRVMLETVVHSGGYTLEFDHAQIDDGQLNVYLTLDAPTMDDLVMEAPQTLTKSFANRARGAREVCLWVRITSPQKTVAQSPYRLATQARVNSN